jgi:hypothetical protein
VWRSSLKDANEIFSRTNIRFPLRFLEGDLEFAIFSGLPGNVCKQWANAWSVTFENKLAFIKKMGSKAIDGKGGDKLKHPYMRKQIAEKIRFSHLSESVIDVLNSWLISAEFKENEAKELLDG